MTSVGVPALAAHARVATHPSAASPGSPSSAVPATASPASGAGNCRLRPVSQKHPQSPETSLPAGYAGTSCTAPDATQSPPAQEAALLLKPLAPGTTSSSHPPCSSSRSVSRSLPRSFPCSALASLRFDTPSFPHNGNGGESRPRDPRRLFRLFRLPRSCDLSRKPRLWSKSPLSNSLATPRHCRRLTRTYRVQQPGSHQNAGQPIQGSSIAVHHRPHTHPEQFGCLGLGV